MRLARQTAAIMIGLLAWGTWIAAGAWQQNRGPLKALIIGGCVLAFLTAWWLLLQRRDRRMKSVL